MESNELAGKKTAKSKRITAKQSSPQRPSLQYEQTRGVQSLFFAGGVALPGNI